MEYKCDLCGAPATVHITKIVNGQKIKMHLCEACAQKNAELCSAGFPKDIIPNLKKLEEEILGAIPGAARAAGQNIKCPTCGTTLAQFEKRGMFSCPDCYKAFAGKTIEILAQMHGAIKHAGKPAKSSAAKNRGRPRKGDATNSNQIELELGDLDGGVFGNEGESDFMQQALDTFKKLGFGSAAAKAGLVPSEESGDSSVKPLKPADPVAELKKALEKAVAEERYEDAAKLRDKINSITKDNA
ncbi:MAG: UvrB/UvrC motif-containing protein [Opitutales bacterium]|nr:UvrB/UvrC motif-containing protein [Opitutales bacterium]